MKVTQTKQMIYNSSGELQQMKFTKSMRKMENGALLMLKNQFSRPLPAICDGRTKQRNEERKSVCSQHSRYEIESNFEKAMSVESFTSKPTVVHYDYFEQKSFNWKIWLFLVFGVGMLYSLLKGANIENAIEKRPTLIHQNFSKSNKVEERFVQSEQITIEAQKLIELYIDELLIEPEHKLSLRQFKEKINSKAIASQFHQKSWKIFEFKIANKDGIQLTGEGDQIIGSLKFEL